MSKARLRMTNLTGRSFIEKLPLLQILAEMIYMFLIIKLLSFDKQNTSKWQYAVLNVATLHYHFGHLQEARLAILEAIKVKHKFAVWFELRNFALIITNRLHKKAVITSALPSAFSGFTESWMVHFFWAHSFLCKCISYS
jgi:hypothetical protein